MKSWFKQLDDILRGRSTQASKLSNGKFDFSVGGIIVLVLLLGVVYGICMGSFALIRGFESEDPQVIADCWMQMLASAIKVPALFLLTLVITFPSLYVFNALIGSQLRIVSVLKLLIAALGVNLAVLASLGPIVAFFSASTPSYPFIVLLNVVVFAISGFLSLAFLFQTLNRLTVTSRPRYQQRWQQNPQYHTQQPTAPYTPPVVVELTSPPEENAQSDGASDDSAGGSSEPTQSPAANEMVMAEATDVQQTPEHGPLENPEGFGLGRHVRLIFCCWVLVYGLVGAQMGWVLRPFIGTPDKPFEWFRERDSSFFGGVWQALQSLLGG